MSLVELGRYDRNLANILVGRLAAEGIAAIAFDGGASIADGSYLLSMIENWTAHEFVVSLEYTADSVWKDVSAH